MTAGKRPSAGAMAPRLVIGALAALMITVGLVACGGSSGSSGGGSGGGEGSGGVIPYGVLSTFTGAYAAYGEPEAASVEYAINKVNEGGGVKVGGSTYTFEMKKYDTGFDPSKAVTETRKAMTQDGVQFMEVVGGELIPPMQPVIGENGVVFGLADGNGFMGPEITNTFRSWFDLPKAVEVSLKYLQPKIKSTAPRVAMFYTDTDEGKELGAITTKMAEGLGFSSSATYVEPEASNYTAALTNVLGEKPDVIDFGADSPELYATAVKEARQLGYEGSFVFPDTLVPSVLNETAGKGAAAGSVTTPEYANFKSAEEKEWAKYVEGKSGPLQGWSALSYDNVMILKAAMERAKSTEPKAVAKALTEVRLKGGFLGEVGFERRPDSAEGLTMVGLEYPVGELQSDGSVKIVANYSD